mmetsp:Transcript_71293/g.206764  ORF Transcript_71293/g.206764 Transcript_71293/m.206764 type:complete len:242 (+) Transcript_71293:1110-1835(+)
MKSSSPRSSIPPIRRSSRSSSRKRAFSSSRFCARHECAASCTACSRRVRRPRSAWKVFIASASLAASATFVDREAGHHTSRGGPKGLTPNSPKAAGGSTLRFVWCTALAGRSLDSERRTRKRTAAPSPTPRGSRKSPCHQASGCLAITPCRKEPSTSSSQTSSLQVPGRARKVKRPWRFCHRPTRASDSRPSDASSVAALYNFSAVSRVRRAFASSSLWIANFTAAAHFTWPSCRAIVKGS